MRRLYKSFGVKGLRGFLDLEYLGILKLLNLNMYTYLSSDTVQQPKDLHIQQLPYHRFKARNFEENLVHF
jgi:hypothetical protein